MAGYDAQGLHRSTRSITSQLHRRRTPSLFGGDFETATVRIEHVTDDIIHVLIKGDHQMHKDWQGPNWRKNLRESSPINPMKSKDSQLLVEMDESPFGFAITRRSSGLPLIDTRKIPGLTLADQYLQISMRVPSQYVYGIGEVTHEHLKHDFDFRRYGFFSADVSPGHGDRNLYGVHPFYLCLENDQGDAHGFFFLNIHAMNVELQPDPSNPKGGIITWRAIGGPLELFLFSGPTPREVIAQYTSLIGHPQFPPYWALGFQLSRQGYKNLTYLSSIFERNRAAGIPQDTQVIDSDYKFQFLEFTVDPTAFGNLSGFIDMVHKKYKMKVVLIVDPAIGSNPTIPYEPLSKGLASGVFIRDNRTGQPLEGRLWPGSAYFVDFTKPSTTTWWTSLIHDFHRVQGIHFDGLWIDMNEPSNFVNGSTTGCAKNALNNPPYNPLLYENMTMKTICMDSDQFAGKHYDLHNRFGFGEAKTTYKALKALFPTKRPFVLSRSTFAGSGKYTNHWLGDNASLWPHMRHSIIGILEFNLFGIPMVGADICGFFGTPSEELCIRWSQLGAFYPFCRNHNSDENPREQDPAAWPPNGTRMIRDVLKLRYGLLPYLYTLMYHSHTNGTTVARPLFFEFPDDLGARTIDDQFLWGSGLMIAPIMEAGARSRLVYFPRGRWFSFGDHTEIPGSDSSKTLSETIPLDSIGLYIRGGSITPWQTPDVNTIDSRRRLLKLLVAFDGEDSAFGDMFWDDGESMDAPHSLLEFRAFRTEHGGGLNITVVAGDYPTEPRLGAITFYGFPKRPSEISIDGVKLAPGSAKYDRSKRFLNLRTLRIDLRWSHTIVWQF